jgi:hypothetical protein
MAVTQAPATEAMAAIVARINTGTDYECDKRATYSEQIDEAHEDIGELRIDVVSDSQTQLEETLDAEDRTSHILIVWVRKKLRAISNDEIDPLKLLVRQIYQRVNDYNSTDGRVKVWEVDAAPSQCPDKAFLRSRLFIATITLRVEVEAS